METEKSKMLAGEIYNANMDEELINERVFCKTLCFSFNQIHPNNPMDKIDLLKKILGKTGIGFHIESPFYCDYGYNIELGDNFYSNHNLIILDGAQVKFGKNVFVGPNCSFYTAEHPLDVKMRNEGLEYAYPITVGDNVWIGGGVTILAGVTIGEGTTIGAGSVVTKDIPAHVLAVGNPCKIIRTI